MVVDTESGDASHPACLLVEGSKPVKRAVTDSRVYDEFDRALMQLILREARESMNGDVGYVYPLHPR